MKSLLIILCVIIGISILRKMFEVLLPLLFFILVIIVTIALHFVKGCLPFAIVLDIILIYAWFHNEKEELEYDNYGEGTESDDNDRDNRLKKAINHVEFYGTTTGLSGDDKELLRQAAMYDDLEILWEKEFMRRKMEDNRRNSYDDDIYDELSD